MSELPYKITLEQLCRLSPEWAAYRIRHMIKEIERLEKDLNTGLSS